MADASTPPGAPERRGLNPIGTILIVALVVLLSLGLFMCTQRGGTVEQNPGAFGPSPPERLTVEDAERIGPPNPPDQEVILGPTPADFAPGASGAGSTTAPTAPAEPAPPAEPVSPPPADTLR